MPIGVRDVIKGRAKVGQMTQALRDDTKEKGILDTVRERIQSNVDQVRERMGGTRSATATDDKKKGGIFGLGILNRENMPKWGTRNRDGTQTQRTRRQKVGVEDEQKEEFGSVD